MQLKGKQQIKVIKTYALLYPGSTSTFCTQHVMKEPNAQRVKTKILLGTKGQKKGCGNSSTLRWGSV